MVPTEPGSDVPQVDVLFVCEANLCRSPFAEHVLRAGLASASDGGQPAAFSVVSAGCRARDGAPMDPVMAGLVRGYGGEPGVHASRSLSVELLATAALVLTATRAHRTHVVRVHPAAIRYTFTLRQFERVLGRSSLTTPPSSAGTGRARLVELTGTVQQLRGTRTHRDNSDDDVVDPWGKAPSVYRRSVDQMLPALEALTTVLGGRPVTSGAFGTHVRLS